MADVPKYYWDACIWIELITQSNPERVKACRYVLSLVEEKKAELWTLAFTLAEVWKKKCSGENVVLQQTQDQAFEDYIERESITKVMVDIDVGNLARRLLRQYPGLCKPQDAIHVASCLLNNIDELHTFDGSDLLKFTDQMPRLDKRRLIICEPPLPPEDPQTEMFDAEEASGQEPA